MSQKIKTYPSGWKEMPLTVVAPLARERVLPFSGQKDYLTTGALDDTVITKLEPVTYDNRPTRADLVVRPGDVLAARMKETNKVLLTTGDLDGLIVSTGFAVFRPTPQVLPGYLYFFLRSEAFQSLKDKYAQGSTQKAINNKDLDLITIPVPPLPVQEHIVDILQKADEIRIKRNKALKIAEAILPATFINTFGDPGANPRNLPQKKLRDICHPTSGGTPSKKNASSSHISSSL